MEALRSGSWLTHGRVRLVALMCGLASLCALVWLFAGGSGTLDPLGRPLGTDFSMLWTAGRMALDGQATDAWSLPKHFAQQQQLHGKAGVDVYGWHYPPPYLLIAAVLATLPYKLSLLFWQALSFAAVAALVWRIVPRREALLLAFAAPVTLICVTHGHNGFLTAALLGGGLLLLERRPIAAGLLLGCLAYKPQFALIIPPLLLVTRNWRAIGGAILSSMALVILTVAIWGAPVWQAFAESLPQTGELVVEQGSIGWYKIGSPFAAMRMWGAGLALSYVVQAVATALAIVAVLFLALRPNREQRNAAVAAAVLLSTPYVLDYDGVVLGIGMAFLWRDGERNGFLPWDRTLMALAWFAPLFARQLTQFTYLPIGILPALIVITLAMRRSTVKASPFHHSRAAFGR